MIRLKHVAWESGIEWVDLQVKEHRGMCHPLEVEILALSEYSNLATTDVIKNDRRTK